MLNSFLGNEMNQLSELRAAFEVDQNAESRIKKATELASAYSSFSMEAIQSGHISQGEAVLPDWKSLLDQIANASNQDLVHQLNVQYHMKVADLNNVQAFYAYSNESNFIEAANRYDRAEESFRRAIKSNSSISFSNAKLGETGFDLAKTQKAMLDRGLLEVQGMHAMIEGERNLNGGDYPDAAKFLDAAITNLERADVLAPLADPSHADDPQPSFTNFAKALRHRTETEIQLISGNLAAAANAEKQRAETLRASSKEHSISSLSSSDFFRRQTKRDQLLAEERAQFLSLAAKLDDRPSVTSRFFFPALVFLGVGGLAYLARDLVVLKNPFVFVLALFFCMVIAAISVGFTSYKDGERTLMAMAKAGKEKKT